MASNTLFVSNFPFATSEDELRSSFEAYCQVSSIRIIIDRQTGRSRGFAFIEVADDAGAQQAIEQLNETQFNGRRMVVSRARGRAPGGDRPRGPAGISSNEEPFRHQIVVKWCEEDGHYLAEVPELDLHVRAERIEDAIRQLRLLSRRSESSNPEVAGA